MQLSFDCPPSRFSRFLLRLIAIVVVSARMQHVVAQSGSVSRLHKVNQECAKVISGSESTDALAQTVLSGAYNPDLAAATNLAAKLSAAQTAYLSNQESKALSDLDVTTAFDSWRRFIGDPSDIPTSPFSVHLLRASLSTVAPSLITKDINGLPSIELSPVEAVYLLDFLIVHGGVPQLSDKMPAADTVGYFSVLAKYANGTLTGRRVTDVSALAAKHLLP